MGISIESISFRKFLDHNGQTALSAHWPKKISRKTQLPCFQVYSRKNQPYLDDNDGLERAMRWCHLIMINMAYCGFHKEYRRMRLEVYNGTRTLHPSEQKLDDPQVFAYHAIAEREQRNAVDCLYKAYFTQQKTQTALNRNQGDHAMQMKLAVEYTEASHSVNALLDATGLQASGGKNLSGSTPLFFEWSQHSDGGTHRQTLAERREADLRLLHSEILDQPGQGQSESSLHGLTDQNQVKGDQTSTEVRTPRLAGPEKRVIEEISNGTSIPMTISNRQDFHEPIWPQSFRRENVQPYHYAAIVLDHDDIQTRGAFVWRFNREENLSDTVIRDQKWCEDALHRVSLRQDRTVMWQKRGITTRVKCREIGDYLIKLMDHFSQADLPCEMGGASELFSSIEGDDLVMDGSIEDF